MMMKNSEKEKNKKKDIQKSKQAEEIAMNVVLFVEWIVDRVRVEINCPLDRH